MIQTEPQAIMAGFNMGSLNREELKDLVIYADVSAHDYDARVQVAFIIDGKKREAERISA